MISDDDLSNLPADPELAFVRFEQIMRERLSGRRADAKDLGRDFPDADYLEYMTKVLAAARAYGIDALAALEIPKVYEEVYVYSVYSQFVQDIDFVTMQLRIRGVQADRRGTVGLDDTTRSKIHHFIRQIRDVIAVAELPDDKKEALYAKLSKFTDEVDRASTALQAGMAVYISICDAIGQGFTKLEPARKWLDSIGALMGHIKDFEDHADNALPPPSQRKRLEPPPKKQLPPASGPIDDDIPF